jgi:hypothetical protein
VAAPRTGANSHADCLFKGDPNIPTHERVRNGRVWKGVERNCFLLFLLPCRVCVCWCVPFAVVMVVQQAVMIVCLFVFSSSSLFLLLNMVVGSSSFVHHGLLQMI